LLGNALFEKEYGFRDICKAQTRPKLVTRDGVGSLSRERDGSDVQAQNVPAQTDGTQGVTN